MTQLKNGQTTEDPRLDRIVQFDERSRQYGITAVVDPALPLRSYTWACSVWLDQGSEGACTGFACGHHRAARPRPGVISNDGARAIYHRARQLDDLPGEDYEGTSVLAAIKASTEFGYIRTYRWAFSLEDLARAVGYAGPAILGINWLAGMAQTGAGGYVHATGDVIGGHAILCRGVNVNSRYFRLRNSWSTGWGVSGDCLISFDDMEKLLHDDGEAAIPTKA